MKRWILSAVVLAASMGFFQASASASGSIGPGPGKVSPRAAYSQGKALTFRELVCNDCPLRKGDLDQDRARGLTASLEAAYEGNETGSPDDAAVQVLCIGADDCNLKMELVHYFLTRRYKL